MLDGKHTYHETVVDQGVHNTLLDIRCPIPARRRRRSISDSSFVTGYNVAISNNGRNYSPSHLLYILDSTCQDTVNVSGELRFALKVKKLLFK